jgi:hypothetical protein
MHLSTILIDVRKEARVRNGEVVKRVLETPSLEYRIYTTDEVNKLMGEGIKVVFCWMMCCQKSSGKSIHNFPQFGGRLMGMEMKFVVLV